MKKPHAQRPDPATKGCRGSRYLRCPACGKGYMKYAVEIRMRGGMIYEKHPGDPEDGWTGHIEASRDQEPEIESTGPEMDCTHCSFWNHRGLQYSHLEDSELPNEEKLRQVYAGEREKDSDKAAETRPGLSLRRLRPGGDTS